jgi:hypothetical protein
MHWQSKENLKDRSESAESVKTVTQAKYFKFTATVCVCWIHDQSHDDASATSRSPGHLSMEVLGVDIQTLQVRAAESGYSAISRCICFRMPLRSLQGT